MTPAKRRNAATAIVFLFGVLASLKAVGEAGIMWPPDAVWRALRNPLRLQLVAGILMIVVALIVTLTRQRSRQD
jgi:ABC-type Fe3+ transport system permease subunit